MNKNQTVLLTGGSGYIGSHLREYFEGIGMTVIAPSRSECDLSVAGATESFCTSLLTGGTSIDYIICNAADQRIFPLHNIDAGEIQKIMQINFGSIAEIYATLARHTSGVQSILTISSIEAVRPRPGHLLYGASKAAVEALTQSAAVELSTIRTNSLRLGLISRPGIEGSWPEGVSSWQRNTPLKRMGELTDVSEAAKFLLSASWITGQVLTLDGGNSVNPGW